jgi:hypothetical protein
MEKRSRSYTEYRKYIKKGGGSMETEGGEREEEVNGGYWRKELGCSMEAEGEEK